MVWAHRRHALGLKLGTQMGTVTIGLRMAQPSQFDPFVSCASDTAAAGSPRGQVEEGFHRPPK